MTKVGELEYEKNAVRTSIVRLLSENASDEQLGEIYDKVRTPDTNERYDKNRFISSIRNFNGSTDFASLFRQDPGVILDAFEEVIGPEKIDALENSPPSYAPTNPLYAGPKTVNILKDRLNEVEQEAVGKETDEAKKQEIHQLMQRASSALEDVHPDVLAYYNHVYTSRVPGADVNFSNVLNRMPSVKIRDGLGNLAGGQYKDVINPARSGDLNGIRIWTEEYERRDNIIKKEQTVQSVCRNFTEPLKLDQPEVKQPQLSEAEKQPASAGLMPN